MDRLLLRPAEAAEAIGIGRSKVYELLASGDLPSIRGVVAWCGQAGRSRGIEE